MSTDQGKVAIITGGASGLGAASAVRLAERGVNVVLADRKDPGEAAEVVEACRSKGVEAIAVQADVSRDEDCTRVAQAAIERFGRLPAHERGIGRSADTGLRPARHTVDMFALCRGKLREDGGEIRLILTLHVCREIVVLAGGLLFHCIRKRKQLVERLQTSCGLSFQQQGS